MKNIKNIIFDYGNVLFEINFSKAQQALQQLGIQDIEGFFAHKGHHSLFDDFETASISPTQFREGIRSAANNSELSDQDIDDAWNSLLIGVSANNHEVLLEVKKKYRIFLLSNNNEIHYNWIINYLKSTFEIDNYDDYFEKAYFSQHMRLRKPNVNIFEKVINENKLDPKETLFIDDSPQHIDGAKKAGLHTLLMNVHPTKLSAFLTANNVL
ncbi:MAG: HAD family hydrolase [Bacteroidia bacterium]